jgi:transposase
MTISTSKSKNSTTYYVKQTLYNKGKITSKVVERLGSYAELEKRFGEQDTLTKAKDYVEELTNQDKENRRDIMVKYSPNELIEKGERRLFSGGYLFLQKIYHDLGINNISRKIKEKYKFDFDLDSVLSRMVYGRILFPASKLATLELSKKFIEPPRFEIQHIYRGLEVLAKETEFIQAELYKNSTRIINRKAGVLYYDCTNYFFEIEQEEGLKQYGYSKEHRPNPLVQMGLFMDEDGIPLAFSINKGNTNEQTTLKPLEKKILADFELSKFVVCTDAGLSSAENRKYNDMGGRAFVTTQSVKKLKKHLKDWALEPTGWQIPGKRGIYDISMIDDIEHLKKLTELYKEEIDPKAETFYKERWINEDGLEQKLIVTYSVKYRDYQQSIRARQVERAEKLITTNPTKLKKANQNDYKRFISKTAVTNDGEIAETELYSINANAIAAEEIFDGFYAVCTNLDDNPAAIIKINHRRWEIEECFRIMKHEFKARPVYLKRDDRIEAHFTTCFISLLIYRLLEKRLEERFTCSQIIHELREMDLLEIPGNGFVPTYTRTDFTDALHDAFGFRTDLKIIPLNKMKKILKASKT